MEKKIKVVRIKRDPDPIPDNRSPGVSTGDIYFYMGGDISKGAQDGKIIADNIREANSNRNREPLLLIKPGIKPGMIAFLQCLDIYENNQDYYFDNLDELIKLEKWFSVIPEPYSYGDGWTMREENRRRYGISDYCDDGIRKCLLSIV